jgi:hypothetical protein
MFFCGVVTCNADHFSALWTMTRKCLASLPTLQKNDQPCWHQCGKMFEYEYLHEFGTKSEFTLGIQSLA